MTKMGNFKIGIVGCGRISQAYVQAINECETIDLTAVMDVRADAAKSAAEAADCKAFTDLDSFAAESGIDAAVICAPPNEHRPVACKLLENGIHVLCEKPFATSYDDALAMVHKANESERVLAMASKFRHAEDVVRAKAMITSGMLGEIQFYENTFCSKVSMHGRWNADPRIAGGGVTIDNGTHSVDIARYLLGPITRISAIEGARVTGLPVDETSTLLFQTGGGAMGTIRLSWSLNAGQGSYINVHGTDGALSIGWQESKYQHNGHADWIPFGVGYNKVSAFKNVVTNFADTVRGAAAPVIAIEDGLASVEVIEAAYRSMKMGAWVDLHNAEGAKVEAA